MTAARVMDIIARLPDCAGQAADAVSACTPVKMEDAPRLLRLPKSECPYIWIRLPRHKWPKSWSTIEDPMVHLERNLYGHRLAGLVVGKDTSRKFCWSLDGKKYRIGNVFFVHRKQSVFFSVYVDDIKMAGRKQSLSPLWKKWMKYVDLDEPTSFLDHVYLGCTQREWKLPAPRNV